MDTWTDRRSDDNTQRPKVALDNKWVIVLHEKKSSN